MSNYGNGLRYGKYAIVYIVSKSYSPNIPPTDHEQKVEDETDRVLAKWLEFESYATKQPNNGAYFYETKDTTTGAKILEVNFDGYYKGRTIDFDLNQFTF